MEQEMKSRVLLLPYSKNCADFLVDIGEGERFIFPPEFNKIPPDKALIVIIDFGEIELPVFCQSEAELKELMPGSFDAEPLEYVLMDRAIADKVSVEMETDIET